jgi:hypothetical protein
MGDALHAADVGRASPGDAGSAPVAAWIDRAVRFFYLHPRTVGRRAQLCLRGADGTELGWKDVTTERVMVRDTTDQVRLVRAILEGAGPVEAPVSAAELPGVALDVPAGALLAQLRLRSAAVLVAKEISRGGDHRLSVTFARPGQSTLTLGSVDLRSGACHPRPESESALGVEATAQLLQAAAAHLPRERYP